MSDLREEGRNYVFCGHEYHLLMTVNVIDQIQEKFDIPIMKLAEILDRKRMDFYRNVAAIMTILLNEAIEIENEQKGSDLPHVTENQVRRNLSNLNIVDAFVAISETYSLSFLQKEEDDISSPNQMSGKEN